MLVALHDNNRMGRFSDADSVMRFWRRGFGDKQFGNKFSMSCSLQDVRESLSVTCVSVRAEMEVL